MNKYLFILGRETELCFAELETVMSVIDPVANIQKLSTDVVLVQRAPSEAERAPSVAVGEVGFTPDFDPNWWIHRLGGTRLIARVIGTVPVVSAEVIHALLAPEIREVALSGPTISVAERRKFLQGLKRLRPTLRYRENHDAYLASGLSERLIRRDDGAEILVVNNPTNPTPDVGLSSQSEETPEVGPVSPAGRLGPSSGVKNQWIVAQVVAVQDTRAWTERDMGLPAPDAFVGMLPPKVARIMVNLAEPARKRREARGESRENTAVIGSPDSPLSSQLSTLLDPFCGSGQIPIEALRLGWTVTASDIDSQGIERTKTNLAWAQERSADAAAQKWSAFQSDIADVGRRVAAGSVDAIVTESDLGPPLKSSSEVPSPRVLNQVAKTIKLAFEAGRTLIGSGGRLVIVIPIIAGNRIMDRLDDSVRSGYTLRATLHYSRPDSRVEREICVFDRE